MSRIITRLFDNFPDAELAVSNLSVLAFTPAISVSYPAEPVSAPIFG
jgi:hypothetical protein